METLVQADIFFFITAVATIVLSLFVAVILVYVAKILKDVKAISSNLRREVDEVTADFDTWREKVKSEGWLVSPLAYFWGKFQGMNKKGKRRPK